MKNVNLIVFILLVFLATSCCDDPVEVARYELNQNELDLVPYSFLDEIPFIHSNNYEFSFFVTLRNIKWQEQHPFCEWSCCGHEYFSYQLNTTKLTSIYPKFEITIQLTANYDDKYNDNISNRIYIKLNDTYEAILNYDENANLLTDSPTVFHDTVSLSDNEFYDVYEIKLSSYPATDTTIIQPESIFYNTEHGILQIKTSNNETYTIK